MTYAAAKAATGVAEETRQLPVGATIGGFLDDLGSTSAAVSETIVNASTFIAVTSSTPSAVAGETVTYSATIGVFAPGSGVPTGLMAFYDGSTLLGVVPLSGGVAQLGVTAGDPGQAHNIIAVYVGDGQYGQSSSPILSQSVVKADATATFTFQATAGRVVFTATVASTSTGVGIPGGTVTFFVNGRAVATRTLDAGSAASVVLPRRAVLNRRVAVRYNGDASFNSAQSPTVVVTRGGLIAPSTPVGTFRARLAAQVARASRAIGLG